MSRIYDWADEDPDPLDDVNYPLDLLHRQALDETMAVRREFRDARKELGLND